MDAPRAPPILDASLDVAAPTGDATVIDAGSLVDASVTFHGSIDMHLYAGDLVAHDCRYSGLDCMDGSVQLDVTNPSSSAHSVTVHVITVTTTGGAPLRIFNTVPNGVPSDDGGVDISAGGHDSFLVSFNVYDLGESCSPGPYRIVVALDVDGIGVPMTIDPANVTLDAECSP